MGKANWRSCLLVAVFALGMAATPRVASSDEDIPPLRSKEKLRTLVWLTSPAVDFEPPPISSIPSNRPFKAIGFEVRNAAPDIAEFARHAMEIRLGELGIAGQVHVIHPPNPGTAGSQPAGVSHCDVLRVTFVFDGAVRDVRGQAVSAAAVDMIATQPVSEEGADGEWRCRVVAPVDQWTLQVGPRVAVVPESSDVFKLQRELMLSLIDTQIVRKILLSNRTAEETFRSWAKDNN
jgi:hypothetical protein